jgi:hypothetical protein
MNPSMPEPSRPHQEMIQELNEILVLIEGASRLARSVAEDTANPTQRSLDRLEEDTNEARRRLSMLLR